MTPKSQSVTSRISKKTATSPADIFSQQPHIRKLIENIVFDVDDRDDQWIEMAGRIRQLREEFEPNRKHLKMTWHEYAKAYLPVKDKNKLGVLARIAEAKTKKEQKAIIRIYRNTDNRRQAKKREKDDEEKRRLAEFTRGMSKRRRALLAWAQQGRERQIENAWAYVCRLITDYERFQIETSISKRRKRKPQGEKT
jgi:hypothetical protein